MKFKVGDKIKRIPDAEGRIPLFGGHAVVTYAGQSRWVDGYRGHWVDDHRGQDVYHLEQDPHFGTRSYTHEWLASEADALWMLDHRGPLWLDAVKRLFGCIAKSEGGG